MSKRPMTSELGPDSDPPQSASRRTRARRSSGQHGGGPDDEYIPPASEVRRTTRAATQTRSSGSKVSNSTESVQEPTVDSGFKPKPKEEGRTARKETRGSTKKTGELIKELEHTKENLLQAERECREYRERYFEALQKEKQLIVDDNAVKLKLESLHSACSDWARKWSKKENIDRFLTQNETVSILNSARGCEKQGKFKYCFLTTAGAAIIPMAKGGARRLIEGFLTHTIVTYIVCWPLQSLTESIWGLDVTYRENVDLLINLIFTRCKDSSRLLHARIVKEVQLLESDDNGNSLLSGCLARKRNNHYEEMMRHFLDQPFSQLLRDISPSGYDQKLNELLEVCREAGDLSQVVWTQLVHIQTRGNKETDLQHQFNHSKDQIFEAHPMMKLKADDTSFNDRPFHIIPRPAILATPIGELSASPKVWLTGLGVIFTDKTDDIMTMKEDAILPMKSLPVTQMTDSTTLIKAISSSSTATYSKSRQTGQHDMETDQPQGYNDDKQRSSETMGEGSGSNLSPTRSEFVDLTRDDSDSQTVKVEAQHPEQVSGVATVTYLECIASGNKDETRVSVVEQSTDNSVEQRVTDHSRANPTVQDRHRDEHVSSLIPGNQMPVTSAHLQFSDVRAPITGPLISQDPNYAMASGSEHNQFEQVEYPSRMTFPSRYAGEWVHNQPKHLQWASRSATAVDRLRMEQMRSRQS